MTKLLTTNYKNYLSNQLLEALDEESNTSFYMYAGVHGDVIGSIPTPEDNTKDLLIDAYRNMIFGKRIKPADASLIIRNIPYETNKVFAKYDDTDGELAKKDFYCIVDETAFFHVYKCLDNNFNANSTVEPQFAFVDENANYVFETSDGYVWKYLYSISVNDKAKFSTTVYFPVAQNANVKNSAISGTIDVIHIEQNDLEIPGGGKKYDNYVTGTFSTNQLRINGNNTLYAISNSTISHQAGFYTGCLLYLSDGTGSGQYSNIIDYFSNANGNFIVLETSFDVNPENGTEFEIYPNVLITGSGDETINVVARALVNSTGSNSIFKIEMLEKGRDYQYATATAVANGVISNDVAFIPAELRPIHGPNNGHGYDTPAELGAVGIELSVKFSNTESNTILTTNRYQQIGVLKDPRFANVNIEVKNKVGTFDVLETIHKLNPIRINSNVSISNSSAVITGQSTQLSEASVVTTGLTGNYIPGDILTIDGGTFLTPAKVVVVTTEVRSVAINAAGTGYGTSTVFEAECQVGTASVNATFDVTTNSTGGCISAVITEPGTYTTNPPFLSNTALVGGSGSGLTVKLEMGLKSVEIYDVGSYAVIPTSLANNVPISNTGTGTGAQLLISFEVMCESDFLNQLSVGDYIYIVAEDELNQQLAIVNSITNATHLTIHGNGFFTDATATMYQPHLSANGRVVTVANITNILVSNVIGEFITDDLFVGISSGAKAQVNTVYRNDVAKNFDTFVQLHKYDISVLSEAFVENEVVFQGNSTALIHSAVGVGNTTILYTSNQVGQFTLEDVIQGANSLAIASVNHKYKPELEFGSGQILYIENINAVNREDDQTETYQVILTF